MGVDLVLLMPSSFKMHSLNEPAFCIVCIIIISPPPAGPWEPRTGIQIRPGLVGIPSRSGWFVWHLAGGQTLLCCYAATGGSFPVHWRGARVLLPAST